MVYANLVKSYIERTKIEANKRAIDNFGKEDGKDNLLYDVDSKVQNLVIDEDGTIKIDMDSKLGYISVETKLDVDDFARLLEIAVKRLNKFKNLLESLK